MPTDEQLLAYSESIPEIYREILAAFPQIEPGRQLGYGVAWQSLAADFENRGIPYGLREIVSACQELERKGLVEIKNRIFVHPTELGERLIGIVAKEDARSPAVEPLPTLPK